MAQTGGKLFRSGVGDFSLSASNAAVTCPASGNTTLLEVDVTDIDLLFVQVSVATQALGAFIIQGKANPAASFVTLYSAAGDYTSPGGLLLDASGDLTAIAASGTGWFALITSGLSAVKVLASGAVDSAAVTAHIGGS